MVTDGEYTSPGHVRGGLRQKMFHMTILGKHDWYLPLVDLSRLKDILSESEIQQLRSLQEVFEVVEMSSIKLAIWHPTRLTFQ